MRMLLVGVPRRLRSIATRTVRAGCAAVLEKLARELPQVLACPPRLRSRVARLLREPSLFKAWAGYRWKNAESLSVPSGLPCVFTRCA